MQKKGRIIMKRSELVEILNNLPDIEVGGEYEGIVIGASESSYTDDDGDHPYIALEMGDD
jgi:hypothetical protein